MDKAKIIRLLDEADDIVSSLYRQGAYREYKCKKLREKLNAIAEEINAPPKSNADSIRQMTDEELAEFLMNADAFSKLAEAIRQSIQNFMDSLPNICIAQADDGAEQYEMQLRTRWKPVRYIRAADRRTDRRPPVHCVRSALSPNRKKDRRTGRKAIT